MNHDLFFLSKNLVQRRKDGMEVSGMNDLEDRNAIHILHI
jgi:hypothetical protein